MCACVADMRGFDRHVRTRVCSHGLLCDRRDRASSSSRRATRGGAGDDASVAGMRGCVCYAHTHTRVEHDAYLAFSPDVLGVCAYTIVYRAHLARTDVRRSTRPQNRSSVRVLRGPITHLKTAASGDAGVQPFSSQRDRRRYVRDVSRVTVCTGLPDTLWFVWFRNHRPRVHVAPVF